MSTCHLYNLALYCNKLTVPRFGQNQNGHHIKCWTKVLVLALNRHEITPCRDKFLLTTDTKHIVLKMSEISKMDNVEYESDKRPFYCFTNVLTI